MKKTLHAVFLLFFLFTGCTTLNKVKESVSNLFDDKKTSEEKEIAVDKNSSEKTAFDLSLKLPSSYDKAYSYRSGKAETSIINYSKSIDKIRVNNPYEYVRLICSKITESTSDEFLKAKMAHDVVAVLISYDAKSFWENNLPAQDWASVLKTKLSVCEGYANVYKYFCDVLQIPCKKVSGYSRGVGFDLMNENPQDSNHAWNVVQLEGDWYLVDSTWDSGYMDGKKSVQSYSTDWLFTKADIFLCTHFPKVKIYQLLENPKTSQEFLKLPYIVPSFSDCIEGEISFSKIMNASGIFNMSLPVKNDYGLLFEIKDYNTKQKINYRAFVEEKDGVNEVTLSLPKEGMYLVDIFSIKKSSNKSFSCGQFLLYSDSASEILFPQFYSNSCKDLQIISPRQMPLAKGQKVKFEVKVSNKNFIAVIAARNFIQLENDGSGLFSGEVLIPSNVKEVSIGAGDRQNGRYETIAVYQVK